MEKTQSYYPKLKAKMNGYFSTFFSAMGTVIHPAAGKNELQKTKRQSSKQAYSHPASPDSLHIRAGLRTQNPLRKNPAP